MPYDASRFRLTIVDVAHGGDDAWYQSLEEDRIIVTPTLVRKSPGPKTWIVGTLAPNEVVEIKTETEGMIEEVAFAEGQAVRAKRNTCVFNPLFE